MLRSEPFEIIKIIITIIDDEKMLVESKTEQFMKDSAVGKRRESEERRPASPTSLFIIGITVFGKYILKFGQIHFEIWTVTL